MFAAAAPNSVKDSYWGLMLRRKDEFWIFQFPIWDI